ncbi:MAG: hypothetical protein LUK37_02625 [Clostridia bacterium]|nr:hypothetical protein [Clostridia bacterium]
MADILRVTSPVINKNIIQPDKASKDPSVPFDMQEIRHITKNPQGSGLLGHHNVLEGEAGAATLMNLLKDPAVTVNYLKNIYAGGNHQSASCEQQYGDTGNTPAL